MSSQKLVRCELRRKGSNNSQVRYVPLEIFGLWEHLMATKHDFEVVRPKASLWLDMEDSPEAAYSENQYERVTEVTLLRYSDADGMFSKVNRYFPTGEYPALKSLLLKHYEGVHEPGAPSLQLKERQGVWIRRETRSR